MKGCLKQRETVDLSLISHEDVPIAKAHDRTQQMIFTLITTEK